MKKIGLITLIALALILVFRDLIIKQVIVSVGSSAVGAPLKVGGFSLSLLTGQMRMDHVVLDNPADFTRVPLIEIAHIQVSYFPLDLIRGKLYFSLIDLDVKQLSIERNKVGQYNVASLKIKPQKSSEKINSQESFKPLDMRIDHLKLNVDRVTFRDEMKDGQIKESNHGVGLHQKTFSNITSPQQLVALIMFESSGLGSLKDIAMSSTKEVVHDLNRVVTRQLVSEAGKTVNSLVGSLKSISSK